MSAVLFPDRDGPHIFALPPGVDFCASVLQGLNRRLAGQSPLAMADVVLYLNTQRARRRFEAVLSEQPIALAPRLKVLGQVAEAVPDLPPQLPPQVRRLELAALTRALIDADPALANPAAAFELAESLAALLAEMQMEGVGFDALAALDPGLAAGHWQRALSFLSIIRPVLEGAHAEGLDAEARFRAAVQARIDAWTATPPDTPVLVVGSTGSRGATAALMQAVARLPQGAVILPGFDRDLPEGARAQLTEARDAADHPQFGLTAFLRRMGVGPDEVPDWTEAPPPAPSRNALVSLALRPAPVTDQWLAEGPALAPTLPSALVDVALVEAAEARQEALAIAVAMRRALEEEKTVALITPDRTLARRVTAALDHWRLIPDDSAGRPLALTAPGIFLRLLAEAMVAAPGPVALLALLRHPLTASAARGRHMALTSALEVGMLRKGAPVLDWDAVRRWASAEDAADWGDWLADLLARAPVPPQDLPLGDLVGHHRALAEGLSAGWEGGSGTVWDEPAGEAAERILTQLAAASDAAGNMSPRDYLNLLATVLNAEDVQDRPFEPRQGLSIWGTLEARTQSADVVILGGLNEGVWPGLPAPDPWLSREMRLAAGLPLPEREIGLSAHDFQQAMGAGEVILTRALRGEDGAPSVASRWVLRLDNLVGGLGDAAMAEMRGVRDRGAALLALAEQLERPAKALPPANRPAPRPPASARPTRLSVTRIETLIRDPYAIYARFVLGLTPLDPPGRAPNQLERGTFSHRVLQRFVEETLDGLPPDAADVFDRIIGEELSCHVPWPATRVFWRARMAAFRDGFLAGEADRRDGARPLAAEAEGRMPISGLATPFTLTATADRIDRTDAGNLRVYDYKSTPPGRAEVEAFAKQLPLTALIAEAGGFPEVPAAPVERLEFIALKRDPKGPVIETGADDHADTARRLRDLLAAYLDPATPFTARLRPKFLSFPGDYDQLSRRGEWEDGAPTQPEDMP